MKDEEAQVTRRRASGSAASGSGVETPFQRAPRPNSQPPGTSESGQLRRSVREIRRSFEAGATDSPESSPFSKPLANSRRSFHFERQSLSWDSSDSDGRGTASNGGTPVTSPIKEVRGSGSKIPVRGGEDKVSTGDRKVGNGDDKTNGPSKSSEESADPSDGVKAIVSPTHGLPPPRTLNEVVVVQTEFFRIDRRGENQDVSSAGEGRTIQERFDYVLPKGMEKDAQNGTAEKSPKKSELTNGTRADSMESENTSKTEGMDEQVGRPSRSEVKANGVPAIPAGSPRAANDPRSDSPSPQKLSATDAAESLEKSKSQIDKLQANLKTPLSSETVNTLKAELSTKSKVPMSTKMMSIPKSMSLPSRITSYLNGLERKSDYQEENKVSTVSEREKDVEKSTKIDKSPEGKENVRRERDNMSRDEAACTSDSKSNLRAQFLKTDGKEEKEKEFYKKKSDDQQKSIISVKTIPVQQVLPLCSPVSSPSKESTSSSSPKLKTPKDISFSVTSDVTSSEDGAIIVSSVASAVLYPSKGNQDSVSNETPMLTNGEDKGGSGSWSKEEHYTVENSNTSYKLIKTTTVVSQKPNADAQDSLHIKTTTPRVVGVEVKKGVEAPEKDFHQEDLIRKQPTQQGEKDKKHTQIPVLVDRGNKSSSSQTKEEQKPLSNPKDNSPEKNVLNPVKAEVHKAFTVREELFVDEAVEKLLDNGENSSGTSSIQKPLSQEPTQNENREGGHEESREKQKKEMEGRNGEASGAGTASDMQRSLSDEVDKNETKSKESPKDEKGGKKMGFMMAVLGGLKDSSKKKKTVPKEVAPKPKSEIKKRRGRVGPPLTEEEIKAMELEAEMRRKKREEEERRVQAQKAEEKAHADQQKPLEVTPQKGNDERRDDKSPDSLAILLGDDDDERSAVRRDAYAELLKKLAKTGEDQEDDAGGGEETDESRDTIGEKTEEDTEGSDTAVEEDEFYDDESVELRRKFQEEAREAETKAKGKPPMAPVPSVRTTSLTSRSISRAPTSPTIMEGEVVTSPMRPTSIAPSSSPVPENVIRSKAGSEESIPKRRTLIETAFIGRDGEVPREDQTDRHSASSRLLRTPSPGLSRLPHTSMVLEERLRRRSASADVGTRRSNSLSPPPVTSQVGRNRGGSNPRFVTEDMLNEEDIEVDRHRPLKQCLNPQPPQPKKPAKTFLQRILRQSPPPPPPPVVKKQPKSPKLPPLRPRFIYDESTDIRTPPLVQMRDPKTASLPVGAAPPRGPVNDQRLRSLSPPTTHAEYHAMQVHYQRQSLQSLNHYGSQRMHSMSPPPLTANRAVGPVRPQPLSYSDIPGRVQYDPRSRSLSPQDAAVTRTAILPNQLNLFVRGSPARTTIANGEGIAQRKIIVERAGSTSTLPNPIFKRGASSEDSVCSAPAGTKKVSFSCSTPTKAEREQMRMMQLREWQRRAREQYPSVQYADDDVFTEAPNKPLPPTPRGDEVDATGRRWLRASATSGSPRQIEVSPTGISESESGSEAGEVRRIMRRRYPDKDDEWGADGKSRGLPGTDQPGGIPGSRGAVVVGGGSGDELEVRRGGGGRPRRDEPRRHTLSHGGSVGGDEVHHHHHHHHHHRGGVPQTGSLARSMDLENNNKMADNGDAFLARMRRKVPLTSTPMTPTASPQLQYIRQQQRPPHPPTNMSLPGYGKTPLPRGSSSGSGSYYPPGMPGGGGGGHGTLDPRSVGHGGMMMGGSMMYEDDDPGIMSEVETASTGFRRGGKQRSSLPVVRTPSKTLERPLGLVFLQYRNETKRALLPNEITSIDTVKALFVRSFPKQLTMEYLDSPLVKIYIHDSSKDMFYELEDLRSHLRDIRDRSVLRLFESDVNGGPGGGVMPGGMVPVPGPSPAPVPLWDQDQSYFSEPEFDSEYHHQHIHKTKGSKGGSGAPSPYYMTHSYPPGAQPGQPGVVVPPGGGGGPVGGPASSATLPRGPLLRAYSPATERIKTMPPTDRMHGESGYMSSPERGRPYPPYPSPSPAVPPAVPPAGGPPGVAPPYEDPYYGQYGGARSGSITPVIDEEARIRVEHMERQLANLTGLVQKALTQGRPPPGGSGPIPGVPPGQPGAPDGASPGNYLQVPASRDAYRNDETYIRSDTKPPKLGKGRDKSVSFEKSVSFSDEPPDMSSPKQHSPQHAERDHRHKPAPPPKPVSLSPGQYEGRHIYRDLHLTPEMYNQLRILQRKAKDLRQEVRNLRRMSQAQAHSVRETIRDTFIKIRAMLLTGGETWLHQQQLIDADRLRTSREEELYKQEMLRLEKDLTELESTVEELRGNVINRKTRVNMSDVENMALILSKSSKTVADLKVRFPSLQDGMKSILSSEMEKVVREEKFLKEEPERLESALRRCKKLTGTLVTLKRLASVQEQRLPAGNSSLDARLSPTLTDGPAIPIGNERSGSVSSSLGSPVSGSPGPNSKPATVPTGSVMAAKQGGGGGSGGNSGNQGGQRPESALDALLDELQTFSRPPSRAGSRKGSMDGGGAPAAANPAAAAPAGALQNSGQGTLRRLHSYPSSDSVGSPVKTAPATVQRLQVGHDGTPVSMEGGGGQGDAPPGGPTATGGKLSPKPPVPERSSDLLARRVPPPPPPRTSSRSPLVSPTSPPNHLQQHRPQPPLPSQSSTSSSASSHSSSSAASSSSSSSGPPPATLPRCMPRRSSTPTRNQLRDTTAAVAAALAAEEEEVIAIEEEERKRRAARREHLSSNSSSSESVNSQEGLQQRKGSGGSGSGGSSKARQEALEQRHRELLRKQKQLQEQYARLQQLQRGGAAAPGCPGFTGPQVGDLKKTGSESNLLARMGHLGLSAAPATSGSLTHLAPQSAPLVAEKPNPVIRETNTMTTETTNPASSAATAPTTPTSGKIYETDIL